MVRKPCAVASSFESPSRRRAAFNVFSEICRITVSTYGNTKVPLPSLAKRSGLDLRGAARRPPISTWQPLGERLLRKLQLETSIKHLRKPKYEYHQRRCFEALTSATNVNIRQIQAKSRTKLEKVKSREVSMDFIATPSLRHLF